MKTKINADTLAKTGYVGMLIGMVCFIRMLFFGDLYLQIGGEEIIVTIGMYSSIFLMFTGMFLSIRLLSKKNPMWLRMNALGCILIAAGLLVISVAITSFLSHGFAFWQTITTWGAIISILIGLFMTGKSLILKYRTKLV